MYLWVASIIAAVLAADVIAASFANTRHDHPARVVGRITVRVFVSYGVALARIRYPEQFITDETRYEAWLYDRTRGQR